MTKSLKILLPILLVMVTVYGAIKGYIYYKVKDALDNAIALAGPYADIEYGGIGSSLAGSVTVESIRVRPFGIRDSLDIEAVRLQWPDLGELLALVAGSDAPLTEPPKRMNFYVNAVRIPLNGELAEKLFTSRQTGSAVAGEEMDTCGPFATFSPRDYKGMGFSEWVLDSAFSYALDETGQALDLQFDYQLQNVQSGSMALSVTGMLHPAAIMMGGVPLLKEVEIAVTPDAGFSAKQAEYCAALKQQSPEQYRQWLADEFARDSNWDSGLVPGAGIRQALLEYLKAPVEWRVQLRPDRPLDLTRLMQYNPEDMLALMGLTVELDGKPVRDLSFSLPEGFPDLGSGLGGIPGFPFQNQNVVRPKGSAQAPPRSRPKRRQRRFVVTDASELEAFVGREVRLFIYSREKPHTGVLVSLADGQALVEQRVYSGSMVAHVSVAEIEKAEVFRVVEP